MLSGASQCYLPHMPGMPCSLCHGPLGPMINEMLALGMSLRQIEKASREKKRPVKSETVGRHLHQCLNDVRPEVNPTAVVQATVAKAKPGTSPKEARVARDLAKVVQEKAVEGILTGQLKVTVKDGLAATAILDKRDARQEDRRFLVGLARLLSGAGNPAPDGLVEPRNVTPNPLLAPPSLRGDD